MPGVFEGDLVVGGDSLIGTALRRALQTRGRRVVVTTRRHDAPESDAIDGVNRVFLDLSIPQSVDEFDPPMESSRVFLVAGVTDIVRCESDEAARRINAESIPQLGARLLASGRSVVYLSTDAVFGGVEPQPTEATPVRPNTAYAAQKAAAETALIAAAEKCGDSDRLTIVRLTKVLALDRSPLSGWLAAWRQGEVAYPFSDLLCSPISLRHAVEAICTAADARVAGIVHLSGATAVDYSMLARALAAALNVPKDLVVSTTSLARGVRVLFRPIHAGLDMAATTARTGLRPQSIDDTVRDLVLMSEHDPLGASLH